MSDFVCLRCHPSIEEFYGQDLRLVSESLSIYRQLPDDEKPIWIGKYESLMQPPRQKLNDKISEVRPDPNENYYTKKLAEYHTIMVMKAARYFNPLYIASM